LPFVGDRRRYEAWIYQLAQDVYAVRGATHTQERFRDLSC
jgi:hypothetical protein